MPLELVAGKIDKAEADVGVEVETAMPDDSEQAEQTQPHPLRRTSDLQRVDAAISMVWRWITTVTIIIGFIATIAVEWTHSKDAQDAADKRATASELSLSEFKAEMRGRLDRIGSDASMAKNEVLALSIKREDDRRDIDRLRKDVDENLKITMAIGRRENK